MTRKDFKLVASVVSAIPNLKTRNQVALNFVSELKKTNERFDVTRFLAACGAGQITESKEEDFSASKENFIAP